MLKKLYVIVMLPCLLYGWGSDYRVSSSDASQGLFNAFTVVYDKYGRQAVFAVQNASPYYLRVYLEDESWTGTFHEASAPRAASAPVEELFSYYSYNDSSTYLVAYLPNSPVSNLLFFLYFWDYSMRLNSVIDGAPDDTLLYPKFKAVETSGNIYLFVACIERTDNADSFLIYVSQDRGATWTRNLMAYTAPGIKYKDIDIDFYIINDTIYLWRTYVYTSNDTTFNIVLKKHVYDPTANSFTHISSWVVSSDSFVNTIRVSSWTSKGILAYDAKGKIKVQSFTPNGLVGSPISITDTSYTLLGLTKGYIFRLPPLPSIYYFGLAYTLKILPITPNLYPIIYTETNDGSSFSDPETLNNNPCNQAILTSYRQTLRTEPAVLYREVYWHYGGYPPHPIYDSTVLYLDRAATISSVRENRIDKGQIRTIFTTGHLELKFNLKETRVSLEIGLYSVEGRLLRTLYSKPTSNELNLNIDISDLSSGIYFIREKNGLLETVRIIKR